MPGGRDTRQDDEVDAMKKDRIIALATLFALMLAVLVLSALPMIILFIIFQDKLVKGMMAGAVKG